MAVSLELFHDLVAARRLYEKYRCAVLPGHDTLSLAAGPTLPAGELGCLDAYDEGSYLNQTDALGKKQHQIYRDKAVWRAL